LSGLQFWSNSPIRRRIAESVEARSPGFYGIIIAVDKSNRTVDVKIQGGMWTLMRVRYNTTIKNPPDYICVNACIHVRHARGSKFQYEVDGPALVIPTPVDGTGQWQVQPSPSNVKLEGLTVVPASAGGLRVCVLTGTFRIGSQSYTVLPIKFGETIATRITGWTTSPDPVKLGHLASLGTTYATVPLQSNPGSGLIRVDSVEIGGDSPYPIIDLRTGTPVSSTATPSILPPQVNHVVLAYINRRYGQTTIVPQDINSSVSTSVGSVSISASAPIYTMEWGAAPQTITITAIDFMGTLSNGITINASMTSGTGTISPSSVATGTNPSYPGQALFTYTRLNSTDDRSPYLLFSAANTTSTYTLYLMLLDVTGAVM
jgi:hypothetical protein